VSSAIPLSHRLRLLWVYARLVLLYNVLISVFGAVALVVVGATGLLDVVVSPILGDPASVELPGLDSLRTIVGVGGVLIATVGHWLGVLVTSLIHHRELPLYRSGGWGRAELTLVSWVVSLAAGVLALVGAGS